MIIQKVLISSKDVRQRSPTDKSTISVPQVGQHGLKGVVVPTVNTSGKGRNVYYSMSDLLELMVMEYLLSVGLSFETAQESLGMLRKEKLGVARLGYDLS